MQVQVQVNAGAATCGSVGDALGARGSYASAAGDKLSIIVGQRRKMVGSKEKLAPEKLSSKKWTMHGLIVALWTNNHCHVSDENDNKNASENYDNGDYYETGEVLLMI